MAYKPEGFTDLASYLLVRGKEAVLKFSEKVLGATRLRVVPDESGGIMHASARSATPCL